MKKKIIGCIVVVLILLLGAIGVKFYQTMQAGAKISFVNPDIQEIADGTYVGECELGLVDVVAQVEVKNGRLQNIQLLKHQNGLGKDAEAIIDVMLKDNTLDVDTVGGATISSKAIRKACEAAVLAE